MTLIGAILKRVRSKESFYKSKYSSPPPELDEDVIEKRMHKKKKKIRDRYPHVSAMVDTSAPRIRPTDMYRNVEDWHRRIIKLNLENTQLLTDIKRHHFTRGKVDCRWVRPPQPLVEFYEKRRDFQKRVEADNKIFYARLITTKPRITTTESLESDWQYNRRSMIEMAALPFILFPPVPYEYIDSNFVAQPGVKRPRVHISLRVQDGAAIGSLTLELFSDVCPLTCQLFTDLVDGDGVGHGYVGTSFFTKVPHLYWSGGDVIYDNGFGCYAQLGRTVPIGAENYHYPHSMPGLLSMRMTRNGEMCGIFNITFKPMPQFDLQNVVFGRVLRPSKTYDTMRSLGSALSTQPIVRIEASKRRDGERMIHGVANERLAHRATKKRRL